MSVADAMKYYPDELAQGNVEFFSGRTALGNTANITGGLAAPGTSVSAEHAQQAGSRTGVPWAQWQRKYHTASSGAGGQVTVNLSQEARQLLKLMPSVNDPATAQGQPAANPYPQQASR
jgi:anti-sigma factor RsiW